MPHTKKNKIPSDKKLRSQGYMTCDEFSDQINLAMREYLRKTWSSTDFKDGLHHPEDLASNALSCIEAIYFSITYFGVGSTNDES